MTVDASYRTLWIEQFRRRLSVAQRIRETADIAEIIRTVVRLEESGPTLRGLCPFHEEKTPSFMVHQEKRFFSCFGCGAGGDVFKFIEKTRNVDYPEACAILADMLGIELGYG